MSERSLGDLAREVRFVAAPISETRPESVNRYAGANALRHVPERLIVHLTAPARKDQFAFAPIGPEDGDRAIREGNNVLCAGLHPIGRDHPDLAGEVDLVPASAEDLAHARGG